MTVTDEAIVFMRANALSSELLEETPRWSSLWTRSSAACCRWPCFGRRVGL